MGSKCTKSGANSVVSSTWSLAPVHNSTSDHQEQFQERPREESNMFTEEEAERKKRQSYTFVVQAMRQFANIPFSNLDKEKEIDMESQLCIFKFSDSFNCFEAGQIPLLEIVDHQKSIALALVRNGCVEKLSKLLTHSLKRLQATKHKGQISSNLFFFTNIKHMLATFKNFSLVSVEVCAKIGSNEILFTTLVDFLQTWHDIHLNGQLNKLMEEFLCMSLQIFHNCSRHLEGSILTMRRVGVLQAVVPYMNSPDNQILYHAFMVLGKIVNESEAESMPATFWSIFKSFLGGLRDGLVAKDESCTRTFMTDVARLIRALARNDASLKLPVALGCLPLLVSLVDEGTGIDIEESIECLSILSRDKDNRTKMVKEKGLVSSLLQKFKTSGSPLKVACEETLRSLKEEIDSSTEIDREMAQEVARLLHL